MRSFYRPVREGTSQVRLRYDAPVTAATFDDPNLVSCAGLVPVMRLAEQAGLHDAVAARVRVPTDRGANPAGKVATIVAGMCAGADSIDDLDVARHGGMRSLFTSVYAPSTLGSFLRTFTHGHVRQLQAAARQTLIGLAARVPLLAGADVLTFVDIGSMLRRVYGKRKQGIGFGHAKVGGYNFKPPPAALAEDRRGERGGKGAVQVSGGDREGVVSQPVKCRKGEWSTSKPGHLICSGMSLAATHLLARWCPAYRRRELDLRLSRGTWEGGADTAVRVIGRREGAFRPVAPGGAEYRCGDAGGLARSSGEAPA
ncbi:hypothetical protein [Plantactinospora sp. KBS50]|uniref:hypothetical protein n=1 Tax=Plantactinospora sp. KBS50 TaxID=2024580 RepID=UPI0035181459